jgi:hypothetical protein
LEIAKKYIKLTGFLKWGVGVALLAIGFYFWEHYLERHFLGAFNAEGLPIPYSQTGFHLFIKTWPLWLFPLAMCWVIMAIWKQKRIKGLRAHVALIEQERINQQTQIVEMQAEIHLLNEHINKQDLECYKNENDSLLQADYAALKEDYHQSKEFIEKLLDKLSSTK